MKRQFSNREKTLIVILALMVIFCIYYILVDQPVRETIESATLRRTEAESQLQIEQARLTQLHAMQQALATLDESAQADVPDYDNVQEVVDLLNNAMALSSNYTLTFQSVTKSGAIASRTVSMSFSCRDYETAKTIMRMLDESQYRCRLNSLSMSCSGGTDVRESSVSVSTSVTFYEYLSPEQR